MRYGKKALIVRRRHEGHYTIDRSGCIYYASIDDVLLNPEVIDGSGMAFVVPCHPGEAWGVFHIMRADPTAKEEAAAIVAYLHAVGEPREGVMIIPAYLFPGAFDDSHENRAALRSIGACWV
ncbi:MAG: hypothetical protein IJ111_11705 [Eggerthellaceae bacterium]|nr:hypothetical protein [Eggerthellaceae bacterium]